MEQSVLNSSLNTQQNSQNTTLERKIYIDRKTGNVIDTINANEIANYIETDTKKVIYIDMEKEFSDGKDAVSTDAGAGKKMMSVMQYTQYKLLAQFGKNRYENILSGEERKKTIQGAINNIVDNKIDFPENVNEMKLLQMDALIKAMGQADAQTLLNNNSKTQNNSDKKDADLQIEALMRQLNKNKPLDDVPSSSQNTDSESALGFFSDKLYRQDTGLFRRPRIIRNSSNIINGVEIKGVSVAISGNGFSFKKARSNVLLNKMIERLENNNPDTVITEIFGFTKRGFGMGRRLLHKKKLINRLADPTKFNEKFNKKLSLYVEHRLRNLEPAQQQIMIQAINKAKNAYVQQHINQAQGIMTNNVSSSLAGQYNPN